MLVCGVVVHQQVQLDRLAGRSVDRVAVGPLDLFEEPQALRSATPGRETRSWTWTMSNPTAQWHPVLSRFNEAIVMDPPGARPDPTVGC